MRIRSTVRSVLCKAAWLFVPAIVAVVAIVAASGSLQNLRASELRLPPDRVMDEQDSPGAVVFSHETHSAFTENRCVTCHPQPFSILGRHRPALHVAMDAGESCGSCHNGSDATDVKDVNACDVCHDGAGARDVKLAHGGDSFGQVVFRHSSHRQACNACHPEPFAMGAGTAPLVKAEMYEGKSCGRCHDGDAAFGVDDGEHCGTCHDDGGGGS